MASQLGVLNALDAAKTQWYHFTAIVIAGMGFFTDAYDLFSISLITKLLGRIYYFDALSKKPELCLLVLQLLLMVLAWFLHAAVIAVHLIT
uniref:Major facilitator superfamily (MFS) profile domain-containing protein n=1 Tax=Gossypium raimondii TaxID=29730 RepID=A0A0D2RQY4_GOSRA|nr:hypothetical protein B456_009G224200 [Gossypium raimondii]